MSPAPPEATFILLAFRQEQFIEQAVRSVLRQDYPNLQIILSDDNSPDRTFAMLERLAADYRGPHRLLTNRAEGGRGLLAHIYHAFARSTGELIVVGAGDDISYPNRVSRLAEEWQRTGADALFSAFHRIDERGCKLSAEPALPRGDYDPGQYFAHSMARQVSGASAAYSRRFLEAVNPPPEPVFAEDFFFSLMLGWRGREVAVVREPLLAYRVHEAAMSSAGEDLLGVEGFEHKSAETAARTRDILRIFERDAASERGIDAKFGKPVEICWDQLHADSAFLDYRARWMGLPLLQRLGAIAKFRRRQQLRWLIPRLFGVRALARLKQGRSAQ